MGESTMGTRVVGRSRGAAALALVSALVLPACGWEPPGSSTSGNQQPSTQPSTNPPPGAGGQQPAQGTQPAGYHLAWSDDFAGTALDASRWSIETGPRRDATNTPDAVTVSGGSLVITTFTQSGVHYTGFVTSDPGEQFTYGYFEARIRLHGAPGSWCAWWLNSPTNGTPLDDPGAAGTEIDVLEHRIVDQYGNDVSNIDVMNVNWNGYGADHQDAQKLAFGSPSLEDNWHDYGVLWTATGYTYYLDGSPVWTPGPDVPVSHRSEHLYFTCEVQDQSWSGNIPPGGYGTRDASTVKMEVDWVRVWQPGP